MRLSWNEVRVRAASFSQEWRDAAYEKGETQSSTTCSISFPSRAEKLSSISHEPTGGIGAV